MKRSLFTVALVLGGLSSHAQLSSGSLAFVGFNADSTDGIAVMVMEDIPGNTRVYFTDNEWNELPFGSGGDFNDYNEGELAWTSGPLTTPAGEIITFHSINNASNPGYRVSHGSITGFLNINVSQEVVYAYQGSSATSPNNFIAALANTGFNSTNGSLNNTGLKQDTTAIAFMSNPDVGVYNRSTYCDSTPTACLVRINDTLNWATEDGTSDQSQNGIYPEFPDDLPKTFTGAALPLELLTFEINPEPYLHIAYTFGYVMPDVQYEIQISSDGELWEFYAEIDPDQEGIISLEGIPIAEIIYSRIVKIMDNEEEVMQTISHVLSDLLVQLYPNPTSEYVTLSQRDRVKGLRLVDGNGKVVRVFDDVDEKMYVGDLRPGVYMAEVRLSNSRKTSRLVVAH